MFFSIEAIDGFGENEEVGDNGEVEGGGENLADSGEAEVVDMLKSSEIYPRARPQYNLRPILRLTPPSPQTGTHFACLM